VKLVTEEIRENLLNADKGADDPEIVVKFFNPVGAQTWLITSMEEDGDTLWGVADLGLQCVEYGTISLSELESIKLMGGLLGIERDLYFEPKGLTISDFIGKERIDV